MNNLDEVEKAKQRMLAIRNKRRDTDTSGLYSTPAKSRVNPVQPSNPQVGDVWTDPSTGCVFTWYGNQWIQTGVAVAQDDLEEIHECKECRYELKSVEDQEWGLCPSHMPDFDAAFTADEHEIYMGKHNGGAMAVGFVRRINQLELLVENLQEQIIELSKGDN